MSFSWDKPLERERRDAIIEQIAQWVHKRQLHVPAIFLLEMHKPVTFLASQGLLLSSGFLAPLFGPHRLQEVVQLLEDRENIERLLARLEALARGPSSQSEHEEPHATCQ